MIDANHSLHYVNADCGSCSRLGLFDRGYCALCTGAFTNLSLFSCTLQVERPFLMFFREY